MTYDPTWTNAGASGTVEAGVHAVLLSDADELAAAVNRRRLLTYQEEHDYSSHVSAGESVRAATFDSAVAPPFDGFRTALTETVLDPPTGTLGGTPPSPEEMVWLWPEADADEGKIIVAASPGMGEVALFSKLNDGSDWTDPDLIGGDTAVRAVHVNELRKATECLRRGRWTLPVYFAAGVFSSMPDTPWLGESVANNGSDELRSLGMVALTTNDSPARGLTGVTVRSDTRLELTADTGCSVSVARCLRALDYTTDPPTWNEYDPSASSSWDLPGASGSGDVADIDTLTLTASVPGSLTGAALVSAVQAMVDGAPANLAVRRTDTGSETITITGTLVVEFELDSPPN